MTNNLTSRQKQIILNKQLTKRISLSIDLSLHADLHLLLEDNPDRFNNISQIIRESIYCLHHFGLDWRSKNGNDDFRKILREELKNVRFVKGDSESIEMNDKNFNDDEGFFSE